MGAKIPRPIRRQVIKAWLEGKSRDKIAEELKISTGAVSGIIKDFRGEDHQNDLLREVAVKIKDQNMDIQSFAPLVRVYEVLREKGLLTGITGKGSLEQMQNRVEALIVALEVLCFKGKISIEGSVNLIINMYSTADKLGIPLDRFPAHITELKDRIYVLRKKIDQIEAKKQDALIDYGATLELLKEYSANKPFLVQIQKLKHQLTDTEEELQKCKLHLEYEEFWHEQGELFKWSIYEGEPYTGGSSLADLKDMVMDVFHYPSRYVEVIRQISDIYNSQYNRQKQQA